MSGYHCDCWDLGQKCCYCDSSHDDGDCHGDQTKECKRAKSVANDMDDMKEPPS